MITERDPIKIYRRKDWSVKRKWLDSEHFCRFCDLDVDCDFQTEDKVKFEDHMMDHGTEDDQKRQGNLYVSLSLM